MPRFSLLSLSARAVATGLFLAVLSVSSAAQNGTTFGRVQNLILNGDFDMGDTGFASDYVFGDVTGPGTYTIGTNPSMVPGHYPDWGNFGDHTTGTGNMFIANGGNSVSTKVWSETVAVDPETPYRVSFWAATINTSSPSPAALLLEITGERVGGLILPTNNPVAGGSWVNFAGYWASGGSTSAMLVIYDENIATAFNDFVLDDITLGKDE